MNLDSLDYYIKSNILWDIGRPFSTCHNNLLFFLAGNVVVGWYRMHVYIAVPAIKTSHFMKAIHIYQRKEHPYYHSTKYTYFMSKLLKDSCMEGLAMVR